MTVCESFFIFDQKYYKQCGGVAMGSPLGSTLANVFMCHFENIWLENYLTQFKPVVCRIYVDSTFLLLHSTEHLSFLDIKISHENNKFVTSFYRKLTFSGVFTNFESFISKCYKRSLIDTLLYRGFSLCSNMEKFH